MNDFSVFDDLPLESGYQAAIDGSAVVVDYLYKTAQMVSAESGEPLAVTLGGLGRFWRSPKLESLGLQGKPSSLGQMLVLGSLGAMSGYLGGKLVDKIMPKNDLFKASRVGALAGAILGAAPGAAGAWFNHVGGRPALDSSFYETKLAGYDLNPVAIDVNEAQQNLWRADYIPVHLKAYTSGLMNAAATIPSRSTSTPALVTPLDIARVAIGMGTGIASANLVGNAMGLLFGTGDKSKQMLQNTGAVLGVLRAVVPTAYSRDPFSLG